MTVICDLMQCPYRSRNRFCMNPLLYINMNGSCGHIYDKNGRVKPNWQEPVEKG